MVKPASTNLHDNLAGTRVWIGQITIMKTAGPAMGCQLNRFHAWSMSYWGRWPKPVLDPNDAGSTCLGPRSVEAALGKSPGMPAAPSAGSWPTYPRPKPPRPSSSAQTQGCLSPLQEPPDSPERSDLSDPSEPSDPSDLQPRLPGASISKPRPPPACAAFEDRGRVTTRRTATMTAATTGSGAVTLQRMVGSPKLMVGPDAWCGGAHSTSMRAGVPWSQAWLAVHRRFV